MKKYITSEDEILDEICFRHYGTMDVVETVLKSNPDTANYKRTLPANLIINFPDIDTTKKVEQINLWD